MDQIIMSKFESITLFCGILIVLSSCLYILIRQNQRRIVIGAFMSMTGVLLVVSSLARMKNVMQLWLILISVLSIIVIWAGVIHLYYRKVGSD